MRQDHVLHLEGDFGEDEALRKLAEIKRMYPHWNVERA